MEAVLFIVLADIGLHNADRGYVLLHAVVKFIISFEDLLEIFGGPAHDERHDKGQ